MNINEISTDALAYLGDSVIELKVREYLISLGYSSSRHLNSESLKYVKASAQSQAMRNIMPLLSDAEALVYKRGRNKQTANVPKSATVSEYRSATGMEVLFGYLYLCGLNSRIDTLFRAGYGIEKE